MILWLATIAMLLSSEATPYSFSGTGDTGTFYPTADSAFGLAAFDMGHTVAVFAVPQRDRFEFDTRCVIVVSRDRKSGWLIDRIENTVRSWEGTDHPAWCDEGKASR